MKTKNILICLIVLSLAVFFIPTLVLAGQGETGAPAKQNPAGETAAPAQQTSNSGGKSYAINNPIGVDDPRKIIGNIINAILGIVGSLALGVFILGGFFWVTSAGNDEKVKKGKDMVMWASFGLAIIFTSYSLVNFVINALTGGA